MNPRETDVYRDTALDGIIRPYQSSNSNETSKRSSRHNRHASTVTADGVAFANANPKHRSDIGRVPTIVHPSSDPTRSGGVQRSFSQRARGRPFADEAFADDYLGDTGSKRNTAGSYGTQVESTEPLPLPSRGSGRMSDIPTTARQQIIQDNIHNAAKAADASRNARTSEPRYDAGRYADENSGPGLAKVSTLKEAVDLNEQREWAPDRSPLQKLEVTLNDISKEEKRARVKEAEMLHREKTRSQRTNGRSVDVPVHPTTIEDVGVVRSLSSAHKDRLMHSTVIESRKPDAQRLANDRQGFEYQSAVLPTRSVTITRRSQRHSSQPQATQMSNNDRYLSQPVQGTGAPRSVSANLTSARDPQSSGYSARQPVPYESDLLPTAMDRNASHKAALQRLEGPVQTAAPRRTQRDIEAQPFSSSTRSYPSGKVSDTPVAGSSTAARVTTPQTSTFPAPLGAQDSPGLRSVDSPIPADKPNPVQRQKRQSSVSFKEPFERRRPVDEWKAAETARLLAEDFATEPLTIPEVPDNKAWWEQDPKAKRRSNRAQAASSVVSSAAIDDRIAECKPRLLFRCGPLLRYTGMKRTTGDDPKEYWRGTVMLVTQDSQSSYEKSPVLRLFAQPKSLYTHPVTPSDEHNSEVEHSDPLAGCTKMSRVGRTLYVKPSKNLPPGRDISKVETDDGLFESTPPITTTNGEAVSVAPMAPLLHEKNGESCGRHKEISGVRLYADPDRDVTFWLFKLEIELGLEQQHVGYRINGGAASGFWVPASGQVMHIMFHSCNGFSISVKTDDFSGPDPLWRDVLSAHQSHPFHVMLGGGDQIYNDKVMNHTRHFAEWTANKNPHYKHHAPLTTEMKEELESFYLENYCSWFSQGLFGMAASQIPMVNMWDDHDIIDGFGSYPHAFQLSPVFSGVGNIAFKYYMLFQQHSVEAMTTNDEPSWVLGYKPGPYIKQLSRSIFLDLGRPVAFLALDCRTERMKNQVVSVDTCDIALERCRKEIIEGQTKHLIVLLGVPIAYPRMNWLENVLTSRAMDPVKALGRYGILKGGFLNRFDGGVEVLDDLDDHWTAHHHKEERNEFVKELQDLAAERSVRITILGGDVHLGAIGQFYSTPKLKIPKDHDHRYMPNIVSSAIVNTPPPEMLADVLNKRNKVHHLDSYTDESMIPMFTHDVDGKKRNNKHLLPRRNWCSIAPYFPGRTPPSSRASSPSESDHLEEPIPSGRRFSFTSEDMNPRGLLRRLSSRKAPPNAYENPYKASRPLDPRVDGTAGQDPNYRAASFDDVRPGRSQPRTWNERLGLTRRTASETRENSDQFMPESNDRLHFPETNFRPGFHRRPTNLSEKAARKGNVPAIDAEGNEINVNDHVNLEGGLDVVLNFEIDRNDPRGATEPYRLLIPGLWYDGSSDREKLDGADGLHRRPTLMNRLGLGNRQRKGNEQHAEHWDDDFSGTESDDLGEKAENKAPKKLGFLGSLRRKRRSDPDLMQAEEQPVSMDRPDNMPQNQFLNAAQHARGPQESTTPKGTPPPTDVQGTSRDVTGYGSPTAAAFNMAPVRNDPGQPQPRSKGNVLRKNSLKREPAEHVTQSVSPTVTTTTTVRNSGAPQTNSVPADFTAPDMARQNSYTIGKQGASRTANRQFDADSAYIARNNPQARSISNPMASHPPQTAYANVTQSYAPPMRATSSASYDNRSTPGSHQQAADFDGSQRVLRGNGILGKMGIGSGRPEPPSSERMPEPQPGGLQRSMSQGYSGIEAYRKPKRGLSLRDRARNLMDRVEGRRKYDDDGESMDSQDFSDDLGEEPPHPRHKQQPGHEGYSDDEYAFDGREGEPAPKRGLSQRLRLGLMGGRKNSSHEQESQGDARYY